MDRELMATLGTIGSGVHCLLALGVLLVGILVVRPRHEQAGYLLAGAGIAKLVGFGISFGIGAARRASEGGLDEAMAFGAIQSLLSIVFGVLFWGGIAFAAYRMAQFAEGSRGFR